MYRSRPFALQPWRFVLAPVSVFVSVFVLFFVLFSIHTSSVSAAAEPSGDDFRLLTYNVHGLFDLIAKDHPRDRMPTIGWLANHYNVVLFQEDFEYSNTLASQMSGDVGFRGNGMGWDPRLVAVKVLTFPFAIFIPHFSPPYGAGLSIFAEEKFAPDEVVREAYDDCHGWLGSNGDCWARKGFLRVRLHLPSGGEVDVYNTHLEAGEAEPSIEARSAQLDQLAEAIERLSSDRPVIVAGDFNLATIRTSDRSLKNLFAERLGLQDAGAGSELPFWRDRDFVLYRSGAHMQLSVLNAGEAKEFVNRKRALSDHPALWVNFRLEPNDP